MAINLEKMLGDLETGDEDIKVLALGTLLQYDFAPLAPQRATLLKIRSLLEKHPEGFSGDMVFLYRQVLDKLRQSPMLVQVTEGAASPPPPPAKLDLKALQAGSPAEQVACLMRIKNEAAADALTEVFELLGRASDERVVASCIAALSAIGGKDDVPRLRSFLAHPDGRVRANAVECVERIGTPLQLLIFVAPLTRDFNKRARANALRALGRLGRDTIVKNLLALLRHTNVNLRGNALYVMENFQGEDIDKLVQVAVRDQSEYIRMEAVNFLKRRAGPVAEALLQSCLKDPNTGVRSLAATALQELKTAPPAPRERVELSGITTTVDPGEELPDLKALKSEDLDVQLLTLRRIEEHFVDAAHDTVVEFLSSARDPRLLAAALRALAAVATRRDLETFQKRLSHADPRVKSAAVVGIEQVGAPRELLAWLTPLLADGDRTIRDQAMQSLLRFRPQVLLTHFQRLMSSPNLPLRVTGLRAAACFGTDDACALLAPVAQDPVPELRAALARALRNRREPWSVGLLERLSKDAVEGVAKEARLALAQVRGEAEEPGAADEPDAVEEPISFASLPPATSDRTGPFTAVTAPHPSPAPRAPETRRAPAAPPAAPAAPPPEAAVAEVAPDVDQEDMLSKSFVGSLASLQSGATLSTLFGKLSAKKHSTLKELSELDKKQRDTYEAMGRRLFELMERGTATHPDFRNCQFVVRKYVKLRAERAKQREQQRGVGGFLSALLGTPAGGEDDKDSEVQLKQQFVFMGKTAVRLRRQKVLEVPELKEWYLDIETIEERIHELMQEEREGEGPS